MKKVKLVVWMLIVVFVVVVIYQNKGFFLGNQKKLDDQFAPYSATIQNPA